MKRLFIITFLVIFACNSEQDVQISEELTRIVNVSDSLGVDIGDSNYTFGKITGAMFNTDSTLIVLDASTGMLSIYSSDEFFPIVSTKDFRGLGPELLASPFRLQLVDSNRIAVFSQGVPAELLIIDNHLNPLTDRITLESRSIIEHPVVINDSIIAGVTYDYVPNPNGGSIVLKRIIGQWNTISGEYIGEYYSDEQTVDIDEFHDVYDVKVAFECCLAADSRGKLYFAPSLYDSNVYIFNSEFHAIDTLEIALLSGARNHSELNLEIEYRKLTDGMLGNWEPRSEYLGVIQLYTQDKAQLLWVRHGSLIEPVFDVYTYGGEYQYRCIVEGLPNQEIMRVNINDFGITAYAPQPYDYPRVYTIPMPLNTIH